MRRQSRDLRRGGTGRESLPVGLVQKAVVGPIGLRHQTRGWVVQTTQRCLGRVRTEPQCLRPQLQVLWGLIAPELWEKTSLPHSARLQRPRAEAVIK